MLVVLDSVSGPTPTFSRLTVKLFLMPRKNRGSLRTTFKVRVCPYFRPQLVIWEKRESLSLSLFFSSSFQGSKHIGNSLHDSFLFQVTLAKSALEFSEGFQITTIYKPLISEITSRPSNSQDSDGVYRHSHIQHWYSSSIKFFTYFINGTYDLLTTYFDLYLVHNKIKFWHIQYHFSAVSQFIISCCDSEKNFHSTRVVLKFKAPRRIIFPSF